MDEPAEDAEADTDASDVGDYEHYCVAVAFEFVHGFGFSGWKKKNGCLSSLSTLYEYCGIFTKFNFPSCHHCSNA